MNEYKNKLSEFITRAKNLQSALSVAAKSAVVYADTVALTEDMMKSLENCSDEMFYPAVYNAAATIRSAPEKCPVAQLSEALGDAAEEMQQMLEYVGD